MDETIDDHDHHAGYFDLSEEERARRASEAETAAGGRRAGRVTKKATVGAAGGGDLDDPTALEGGAGLDPKKRNLLLAAVALLLVFGVWIGIVATGSDDDVATDSTTTTAATASDGTPESTAAPVASTVVPGVEIEFAAGKAVITGPVQSDEVRQLVIGGATILYQAAGAVEDGLTVDPAAGEINPYEDPIIKCLGEAALQGVSAQGVRLDYEGSGKLRIAGKVTSAAGRDRIVGAVAGVAGGLDRIVDDLEVVEPTTTTEATDSTDANAPPTTKAPERVQQDIDALLAGKVVEFDTGSATLNNQWAATVDEVATILKGGTAKVQVAGHTDNVGDPAANLTLSNERAETIRAALVARGVAADRLSVVGYGQDRPIADNASDEGRQRNRRIEFVVAAG